MNSKSNWVVRVMRTREETIQGVVPLQKTRSWSPNTVLVFPNLGPVRMSGLDMIAPVVVIPLDAAFKPLKHFVLQPGKTIMLPINTVHVVEMHPQAPKLRDFAFVQPYLL
jgi:hypothetical protein